MPAERSLRGPREGERIADAREAWMRAPMNGNLEDGELAFSLFDSKDNHHMRVSYRLRSQEEPEGRRILSGQQTISLDDGTSSRQGQCLWIRHRWPDALWKVGRVQWKSK